MAVKKKATTDKKAVASKTKTAAAADTPRKVKTVKESYSKTTLIAQVTENTGLTKKQVTAVFDELKDAIEGHLKKGGAQSFTLPGLLKVKVIRKPATKARKGINPFTGAETIFKAKPARNVVKIQPLKALKDMVA